MKYYSLRAKALETDIYLVTLIRIKQPQLKSTAWLQAASIRPKLRLLFAVEALTTPLPLIFNVFF